MSDARRIKHLLRERVAEVAQYLFPNGHSEGVHWCVGSIDGEPGKSFKICIAGPKPGLWGDFAGSERHSRSLLDLWMAARKCDFKTALREAAEWLGVSSNGNRDGASIFPTLDHAIAHVEQRSGMRATRRDWYRDCIGNGHFVVARFDGYNKDKDFRPFHRNASGWIIADPPGKLSLFYLPELVGRPTERVFVVEGEKCTCDLATLGLLVTTSAHGAKSANKTDWQPLAGREVVILPDNDAEGRAYAQTVAEILTRLSPQPVVKIVELPGLPPKGDCVDWLNGRDAQTPEDIRAELLALVQNAEMREPRKTNTGSTKQPEETEALPFPLNCLPPVCAAIAKEVCATERVPGSLVGCCALGILSASIGAGLAVRSASNRVTRGNIYVLASADSGSGKSETFRHMAKPLQQFEMDRIERWKEQDRPDAIAQRDLLDVNIKECKKQYAEERDNDINEEVKKFELEKEELEKRLHMPTLTCEDVTSEKLADLLSKNDEQLASVSSDALSIVNILLGRYNKLDRTDESLYLKAFSGDPCVIHRMSRDPIFLKSPCLTALWLTQPDKLQSLLGERSLNEGGLIPRILACHTNCGPREIGKNPPSISTSVEKAYAGLIFCLLETYRLAPEPFTIEPTAEALEALNDHHDAIVKRRRGELRDVTSYAARWNEQAWRIAVCLHAGTHGSQAHEKPLSLETAQRAIALADWFAGEQLRILKAGRTQRKIERLQRLKQLLVQQYNGEATLRTLHRNNGFEPAETRDLATQFPEQLVIERHETGGRPSEIVRVSKK